MKTAHLVCNAHLDPVWQWEWEEGAGEALSTFRIAADFCEKYDGFVFNHNEAFNSTVEESAELAPVITDITALIGEMQVKFIIGELDFDKDWDGFMEKLDKAGAQKYLQNKAAAV